jgi:hypothetical protein
MERSCTTCDKIDTKVISPTGNHHFGSWITVQVVSQTQEGIEERICTVCGSKETKIIDMITSPTVSPDTEKKKSTPKPDSTQLTKEAISTPASAITTPTAITTDGSKEFSIGFNALDGILAITNAAAAGIYATLIRRDQYIINWDKHRKALGVGKQ